MTTKRRTAAPGVELVPVDALELHPANPRQGDIGAIVESIQANGWWGVVVAQTSTRRVLVGNHRLQAARLVGMDAVPVHWLDVPDDVALRVLLADNRSNDRAAYDDAALADLLSSILADAGTLDGTLFDGDDLDALLADLAPLPTGEATDDVPPLPVEAKTRVGDVFELGPHRLVCGDCTDRDTIAAALNGDLADMMFTDPPYAVAVSGAGGRAIHGDLTTAAISAYLAVCAPHVKPGGAVYTCCGSANITLAQKLYEITLGMLPNFIVWDKEHFILRHHGYHSQFEMIAYGWTANGGRREDHWYGDRKGSDVWRVPRDPSGSYVHPTQKPVELATRAIRDSCPPGGIVLEPFGGSGSTLVAADALGRRCVAIELDPAYCDVIRKRYADHANRPDLAP